MTKKKHDKNDRGYKIVVTLEAIDSSILEGDTVPRKKRVKTLDKSNPLIKSKNSKQVKVQVNNKNQQKTTKMLTESKGSHVRKILQGRKRFLSQPRNLCQDFEKEASEQ